MGRLRFYLDGSKQYNHGCCDSAVLQNIGNGKAIVVEVSSCHSCWQVGHDLDHEYMKLNDILSIEEVLNHPDLIQE